MHYRGTARTVGSMAMEQNVKECLNDIPLIQIHWYDNFIPHFKHLIYFFNKGILIDQPSLLMHIDMDLMGLRQSRLSMNTMVTRYFYYHLELRLDWKTCYSIKYFINRP